MDTHASGVNYNSLDEFKRNAQIRARQTHDAAGNLHASGWEILEWTLGESVLLLRHRTFGLIIGFLVEGLGTKNLIAEHASARFVTGKNHDDVLGWDLVAMIVNDCVALGALPIVLGIHPAVGDADRLTADLVEGFASACEFSGAAYGPGETPQLSGIIPPNTMCLSGAGLAVVPNHMHLIDPEHLRADDEIFMLASSGIHANGISAIRNAVKGYGRHLDSGETFAEALLRPTQIYVPFIRECQKREVILSYATHISGHGWAKLLRARKDLQYRIHTVPEPGPLFCFIQQLLQYSDRQMYSAYNMGQGFAVYVRQAQCDAVIDIARSQGIGITHVGTVEKGPRRVIIPSLDIEFTPEDVDIR